MSDLATLEGRVLQMLLHGDDDVLAVLRQQAKQAKVSLRKLTGVGFFTEFDIPSQVPRVTSRPTFRLGDVNGAADNVKHGLGFVLYVNQGVLSTLEGYTYDEPWPDDFPGLLLTYSTGQGRNLEELRKITRTK